MSINVTVYTSPNQVKDSGFMLAYKFLERNPRLNHFEINEEKSEPEVVTNIAVSTQGFLSAASVSPG